jgi:hypothetical protein
MNYDSAQVGLQGDYRDSCFICLRGTDSALGFQGEPEWICAALIHLGIPEEEATELVFTLPRPPSRPDSVALRVCRGCAERAGLTVGLAACMAEVPLYVQPAR